MKVAYLQRKNHFTLRSNIAIQYFFFYLVHLIWKVYASNAFRNFISIEFCSPNEFDWGSRQCISCTRPRVLIRTIFRNRDSVWKAVYLQRSSMFQIGIDLAAAINKCSMRADIRRGICASFPIHSRVRKSQFVF